MKRLLVVSLAATALLVASAFPHAAWRTLPAAGTTALDTFLPSDARGCRPSGLPW